MPAWVWRDVRSVLFFYPTETLLCANRSLSHLTHRTGCLRRPRQLLPGFLRKSEWAKKLRRGRPHACCECVCVCVCACVCIYTPPQRDRDVEALTVWHSLCGTHTHSRAGRVLRLNCKPTTATATKAHLHRYRSCTAEIVVRMHRYRSYSSACKKQKKTDRTSRQTQAGIGHSARAHRGGHVQNRISRRQVRRGKTKHSSEAEQPRTDGGPGRQGKACQHRRGRGLAGARRSRHPKKERCDKIQTPQLHVPRGHTAQGSCRVEQERDNTSRGSNNGDTTGRKRRQQHRLRVIRPRAHPEEVIPEKGKCYRAVQARDTLAFKQQVLNVAPSVFPSRLSPRSRTTIRA